MNNNRVENYHEYIRANLSTLSVLIHRDNVDKGFWEDWQAVQLDTEGPERDRFMQLLIIEKLALAHGELSEALEAMRKGEPVDNHLPQYKAFDVELADALIRILDIIGARQVDIMNIVADKLAYNKQRAHKHGKEL